MRAAAFSLVVPLAPQISVPHQASVSAPVPALGTAVSAVTPVPVRTAPKQKQPAQFAPKHATWPTAASGTAQLAAATGTQPSPSISRSQTAPSQPQATLAPAGAKRISVQGTPVWVALPSGLPGAQGPSAVAVSVVSHQKAVAAGVNGVVFTARATAGGGRVQIGLDYSSFAQAYGGNYGTRLNLVQLPACALTTPNVAACRTQTKLDSTNDPATQSVSARVPLGAAGNASSGSTPTRNSAASATTMVLAATASVSGGDGGGAAGQFGATTLKPSGTWSAGGSTGAFTYTYPIDVPPAASALAPQVALSYDSGGVDGQTAASQSQADWVGDGWSTPESFVEQSFVPCSDSPEGSAAPQSTQDACYDGPILTLSLNG